MKKPQKKSLEYLDLIPCLDYVESLGHEGYKQRMWDKVMFNDIVNGGYFYFDINEEYADPKYWLDIKLLRDTFDLGDGAIFHAHW